MNNLSSYGSSAVGKDLKQSYEGSLTSIGAFNEEVLKVTFITREAPLPVPDVTLPLHSTPRKLIGRRCIQGTLASRFNSPNTKGWLRSVENAVKALRSLYPSGLPNTMKQTTLPNCTSNLVFLDPMSIMVCDAVDSHPNSVQYARKWHLASEKYDPGTNYWLFLTACSSGDRSFIQQTLQKLESPQKNKLPYLSGLMVHEGWQEAFRFLADEGYEANQLRGASVIYLPKPPPIVSAIYSERVDFLKLILEYPCGLIKSGNYYELAIEMALNMENQLKGNMMADLLYSHGHNLTPREELRERGKREEFEIGRSKTGHLIACRKERFAEPKSPFCSQMLNIAASVQQEADGGVPCPK